MKPSLFNILISVILAVFFIQCKQKDKKEENEPLNVVFFLVDDLGWKDVGINGSTFYETPHIDRFAEEAVQFTNAYAACHVCSPTRASILTGMYPASLNLTDWLPGRPDYPFQKLKNVEINQHIPYGTSTLPQVLKENGYQTAIFGKWHLGEDSASTKRQGFDMHVPNWNKGWPNKGYFSPFGLKGLGDVPDSTYLTDKLTSEALSYIESNRDKPFFLYLALFAVHDPIEGRRDLVKKYQDKLNSASENNSMPFILEGNPDAEKVFSKEQRDSLIQEDKYDGFKIFDHDMVKIKQHQDNVEFAAMVDAMDENFGKVLNKLEDLDIDDRTVVIFYSDNGGMSAANFYDPDRVIEPDNLDKAFSTSNTPLRAGKGWLYEGGIRVPLLIKWPGKGLQGATCDVPVTSPDFFPTILEMLNIQSSEPGNKDGVSLASLLMGEKSLDRQAIFWHFPHYSNHGMQSPGAAVRAGDYKLLEYFENNSVQLFNLKNDMQEQNDISSQEPEKVKELKQLLHQWQEQTGARQMQLNPDYKKELIQ